MKIIGITGGVGAGKSQILEYLNDKYGATICMADEVGKHLQKKGRSCYAPIVEHFGEKVLDEKGELNRAMIADIVFNDESELEALNQIVHPMVRAEIIRKIKSEERKSTNLFILESAILIEAMYKELCDEVWYVYVPDDVRKKRLMYSRGYAEQKVDDIISAQMTKAEYMKQCDRVIDNGGVFGETTIQLDKIVKEL